MTHLNIGIKRSIASALWLSMVFQLFMPVISYALTSGPSQPELQSFEPVGTTDMVNTFSGDFVYNIPLLDVEGYPVNIAYHSGITTEQEASWVGLGWNINPGNINHGVRGLPDDFNGETIEKEIEINEEVKQRFGAFFGLEVAGVKTDKGVKALASMLGMNLRVGGNMNMGINISNYTGVSASLGVGTDASLKNDWMSAGVNMGATFTTDNGVDIDKSMSASLNTSGASNNITGSINGYFGKGYNSREGLKYTSFGVNPAFAFQQKWNNGKELTDNDFKEHEANNHYRPEGVNNTIVPISMQNFVPVITNVSFMESSFYQFKVGIEATATIYPNFGGSYGQDNIRFQEDGSRRAYGFFNLQNASKDDITDFTRDRDGRFSRDMKYLPPGNMTYDIYAVNGQGTAGNFRSFRNDIGTVYDPYTNSDNKVSNHVVEIGAGNIFEAGWDHVSSYTSSSSGPWNKYKNGFSAKKSGSLYEPHYFKQAGELSQTSPEFDRSINGSRPLRSNEVAALNANASPLEASNLNDDQARVRRANLLYYFTAEEASNPGVSLLPKIPDYQTQGSLSYQPFNRVDIYRKPYQASEFTQLLPDGRRYIYGIPAMNNTQVEYVVGCDGPGAGDGTVDIVSQSSMPYGGNYGSSAPLSQQFFMKTTTPAYAHSYLLTSILSPDYSDLTGDGLSDDDLGTYTKFNYTRKERDYRWRTPFQTGVAQYDKGVASDCHDDKATFIVGSKEIWMLHSIESKNYIAEFYTSSRDDAKGSSDNAALTNATAASSYKLDSIVLYNKKERIVNHNSAIPIKKIVFTYDYSLCPGTPNSTAPTAGKLTLKAISVKFGNSDAGYLSPYRFSYSSNNPAYSIAAKDMWGNYKAPAENNSIGISLSNHEFPYVRQDSAQANQNATAWNLTKIKLPSGGSISVSYEADDYAYVQNRRSMAMFKVAGVGPDTRFVAGTSLYQSQTNPYLYVYFRRNEDGNGHISEWFNDMRKAYLDNGDLLQFNFKVKMSASGETTPSCNIPLEDNVKGYAGVEEMNVCSNNPDYGYIKLSPKNVDKMPGLSKLGIPNLSLNPVTLSAIFYAKYYNSKALYPSSEILSINDPGAIIKQLLSSFADIADYFRSPIAKYLNEGRAKYVNLDQSYIRLCCQGKKIGGGHRVKRIEFSDNWDQFSDPSQPVATYGSEYDYTTVDEASGQRISSGVATYEPIFGGDENPFKEPIATDRIGFKKDFPVTIPTELITEGPIGESMYPAPDVGYSKVTVTSIHKSEGASSQAIQMHEFFTAKDFPVRVQNTELEQLENKEPKPFDFSPNKKEAFRVAQGYALFFNDMHGKPKKESVLVAKGGDQPALVSYKIYEYFTNPDNTLNNDVPCMYFDANNTMQQGMRTLGVEKDIMLDSREKLEKTNTTGFMANLNIFMGPVFPIPIPTAFPKIPKSAEKAFSSIVNTKIIQQYGILKSVETFNKGAAVKLSNELFDPNTGQPLITKVNTEHKDYEFQVKYPAYWAYRCMGLAYKNILYEEQLNDRVSIVNDTCYITTDHPNRFNMGDELLMTIKDGCSKRQQGSDLKYKLWVVNKNVRKPNLAEGPGACDCPVSQKGTSYSQNGQQLPSYSSVGALQDPNYTYLTEKTSLGILQDFTNPALYQPCSTTHYLYWPDRWITGNISYLGYTYFKTHVNVSDINKSTIKVQLEGDWDYEANPTASDASSYYVNGAGPYPMIIHQLMTPIGLVAGVNEIIFKVHNGLGTVMLCTTFENCPEPPQYALVALPIKRGALSVDGSNNPFPANDKIYDAQIKVIRSGRRNQLQETVQDLAVLNKSGAFSYSNATYNGVLSTDAQTFTDEAAASATIAAPTTTYYNPYVTGRNGNYRILAKYNINLKRDYTAAIDPGKGIMNAVRSFWLANSTPGEYYNCLAPGTLFGKWTSQAFVKMYSPWGNDLEVQDAAGNIQANLFGYGNSLLVASVNNSHWDNALFENFEDNAEPASTLDFCQNALHQFVKPPPAFPVAVISSAHHSGSHALQVTGNTGIGFPICTAPPSSFAAGAIYPFHFRPGKHYIVSYWQQANQNTANPGAAGSLSVYAAGTSIYVYPKTPVIDGWVLYEGEVTIPSNPLGMTLSNAVISLAPSVLDDIRILPVEANMKSYVYNPLTRKLVAVLDENHMTSFFEYDAEGKLVRVKKETEKGILTLKESRSSLHHIVDANGSFDLKSNQ